MHNEQRVMKKVLILIIYTILVGGALNAQERNYFEQISFIATLGDKFHKEIVGHVNSGNEMFPVYKISYNMGTRNKKKYLVICGVHGNEPAPVFAIRSFLVELDLQDTRFDTPRIDFIYMVNPWGFINNSRYNSSNLDINRDLATFQTKEAQILRDAIDLDGYDCVFDFHEGNTRGYYLYYYDKKHKTIADSIIEIYRENSVPIENEYIDVKLKTKEGLIYVPWYARVYMSMKKQRTITLWSYERGIERSFTLESSKNRDIQERVHVIMDVLRFLVTTDFHQ